MGAMYITTDGDDEEYEDDFEEEDENTSPAQPSPPAKAEPEADAVVAEAQPGAPAPKQSKMSLPGAKIIAMENFDMEKKEMMIRQEAQKMAAWRSAAKLANATEAAAQKKGGTRSMKLFGSGKKSRKLRKRTIGGKKSRKLRKRTTLKGGKRKRRRTRCRR